MCGEERKRLEYAWRRNGTEAKRIKGLVKTLQRSVKVGKDEWKDPTWKLQPAAAYINCWNQMCINLNCDKHT